MQDPTPVPIDFDRSLANFDLGAVGSCAKSWARLRVGGESPHCRASHSATALDCFRFVVVGGGSCTPEGEWTHFADAHVFDVRTRAWRELVAGADATAGAFTARRGHAAALWRSSEVLIFGGTGGTPGDASLLNDCWCLDTATPAWRRLQPSGQVPAARRGALGFFVAGHFLVAGGYVNRMLGSLDPHIYAMEPETQVWSRTLVSGETLPPFAVAAGTLAGQDCLYVFGGSPGVGLMRLRVQQSCNVSNSDASTRPSTPGDSPTGQGPLHIMVAECAVRGEVPSPRFCHGMVSIADRWLLVFGGTSSPDAESDLQTLNDCYLLDLQHCGHNVPVALGQPVMPSGPAGAVPHERNGFTMVGVGTKFVIFGGGVYREAYYNDTWALDLHLKPDVAIPVAVQGADIGADFAWLRESDEGMSLADVTLAVGQGDSCRSFPAHRAVLCARSDYFRALLAGGFRESAGDCRVVTLPDLDSAAFELVLSYIYTGRLLVPEPAAMEDEDPSCSADQQLLAAARAGDVQGVTSALDAGADPDARDRESGGTALHLIAASEAPEEYGHVLVSLLARARADLSAATPLGATALQLCALHSRKAVAAALILALRGSGDVAGPSGVGLGQPDPQALAEAGPAEEPEDSSLSAAVSVLLCADRLGLPHLGLLCEQWLARALRPGNACQLLELADELRCAQLRLVCLHFLKQHGRCRRSPAFAALPQSLQEEVLLAARGL
mmetsp:Transcript_61816/g.180671  ORF Transcript_61816/g.180671 Transcript_61816/m.180671 type:complete len:725 (-) Transcript_61816:69-2243(-)